ncbi:hypothetical protein [Streptomyces bicolor]|nr:hypothetical protein [Streptomyces bicolor]
MRETYGDVVAVDETSMEIAGPCPARPLEKHADEPARVSGELAE